METTEQVIEQPIVDAPVTEVTTATQDTPTEQTQTTEPIPAPVVEEEFKPLELNLEQPATQVEITPKSVLENYKGDQKALLKELGLDDFIIDAVEYYKQTKSLQEYAEVKSVDYTKVSDDQVIERKLREQFANSGLPDETIKLLVEDEMQKRYPNNPELADERSIQVGKARMQFDANNARREFIERQQKFRAPERVVEDAPTQVTREQQVLQAYNEIKADPAVQGFLKESKLKIGEFSHTVEKPNELLGILADPNRYLQHIAQKTSDGKLVVKDGQPVLDRAKMIKIAAYVRDMEAIEKGIYESGKTAGKKTTMDEAENIIDNSSKGTQTVEKGFWQQFKDNMKITT